MGARYTCVGDMFDLIAVKQRIYPDTVDQLVMAVLLALDATIRSRAVRFLWRPTAIRQRVYIWDRIDQNLR